jgi:hypothetical protein
VKTILLLIISSVFYANLASAASVLTIKDGKWLLNVEDTPVKVGDTFFVSSNGRKKAIIEVKQVKSGRAIAQLVKGQANQDPKTYQLQLRTSGGKSAGAGRVREKVPAAWGFLLGYSQNQMKVNLTASSSVSVAGSSFNVEGFYLRQLDGHYQVLARYGYDTLKATGTMETPSCLGSTECSVDIGYLDFDGLLTYSFNSGSVTWWLGGGIGFLYPLSKSSNVLDTSKLGLSEKILADIGLNYYTDRQHFIPFQVEYVLFPNNSVVSSSQIIVRLGYGIAF